MSKWSLNSKMYFVLSIFVVASIAIASTGLMKMNEIKSSLNRIVHQSGQRLNYAHEIRSLFLIQMINEKNLILEETQEGMKPHVERLNKRHNEMNEAVKGALKIASKKGEKVYADFNKLYNEWYEVNVRIRDHALAGEDKNAHELSSTLSRSIRLKVEEMMEVLVKSNQETMMREAVEAEEDYISSRNFVLLITLSSLCAGFFSRSNDS